MLDIAKGRNSWTHLKTYYKNRGDTMSADASDAQWKSLHPDVSMLASARRFFPGEGRVREATALAWDTTLSILRPPPRTAMPCWECATSINESMTVLSLI
jgi:hypothetical protein